MIYRIWSWTIKTIFAIKEKKRVFFVVFFIQVAVQQIYIKVQI